MCTSWRNSRPLPRSEVVAAVVKQVTLSTADQSSAQVQSAFVLGNQHHISLSPLLHRRHHQHCCAHILDHSQQCQVLMQANSLHLKAGPRSQCILIGCSSRFSSPVAVRIIRQAAGSRMQCKATTSTDTPSSSIAVDMQVCGHYVLFRG